MALRIILGDDHSVVRLGVRALLQAQTDFDVVGEAGDGLDALRLIEKLQPDIVVLDHARCLACRFCRGDIQKYVGLRMASVTKHRYARYEVST